MFQATPEFWGDREVSAHIHYRLCVKPYLLSETKASTESIDSSGVGVNVGSRLRNMYRSITARLEADAGEKGPSACRRYCFWPRAGTVRLW